MTIEAILKGESQNVEFKVQRPDKSIKYMKSVVAFANGKGGRILFGIDDKTREIVGIPEHMVFQEIDAIANAISDSCEPTIIPDVYLQNIAGKAVIVAEISAGRQKPYYIKADGLEKGVYIRVSGTTRPADRDIARELYYECDGRSYDSVIRTDLQVTDEEIEALCEQMHAVALANSKSAIQRKDIKAVTKNVLLSWGILQQGEDGTLYPTNAYVYLTGRDKLRSCIQCGAFKGTTRSVFVDKRDYDGPLWEQVDHALKFVLRNIRLGSRIQGVYRRDVYELPPDSIRELIVNAVMNCSYIQTSHIQVALYNDRLEITSPGGLLPGVTIDLMKQGFSKIRNRSLASAFAYMNLVEAWGSGIPKLLQSMSEYGLEEPEFVDMGVAFRVNLYRRESDANNAKNGADEGANSANNANDGANEGENDANDGANKVNGVEAAVKESKVQKLLYLIAEDSRATQAEYAVRLGVSKRTVSRMFVSLQEQGVLERRGTKRNANWVIRNKR